jgi:WD40 repeat protein
MPGAGPIDAVAIAPDGKKAAWVTNSKTIVVWDLVQHQQLLALQGHTDMIWSVAFSPDGKRLASASADRAVRTWDLATGKEQQAFLGHKTPVSSVAFSGDGALLVTGSGGVRARQNTDPQIGEVRIWNTATGKLLFEHTGKDGIWHVACSPNGRWVAASVWDGVLVYRVKGEK